jgi:hypothetical protein
VSDAPFENLLFKLWSELPHNIMEWRAASHTGVYPRLDSCVQTKGEHRS